MYKHYIRTDSGQTDDNGDERVILIFADGVNGTYQVGDIELTTDDLVALYDSQFTVLPRQAHMFYYVSNHDSTKKYVWNGTSIAEWVESTSEYGQNELDRIESEFENTLATTFADASGDYYLLDKLHKLINLDNANRKAEIDAFYTAKFSFRDSTTFAKKNKTLDATEIQALYDAAFTHVNDLRVAWNDLEDDVWAATSKSEVDTHISTFESTYLS